MTFILVVDETRLQTKTKTDFNCLVQEDVCLNQR